MMRRQSIIALAIAVALGLFAVYIANAYWSARDSNAADNQGGMVNVAVAAIPLDFGSPVTPDKIRFAAYPARSLPPGTFSTINQVATAGKIRIALRPIQVNQLLLASDLTGEGQGASIAALLKDGMRAASVRVNDVSGVSGFIKPNDTVDVLITRQALGVNRDAQVTDVLLQNVRVMAIDQQSESKDSTPSVARTTTLEVSPLDAQKLALGQQLGALSLVLRKPGVEQNIPYVETVSLEDLRYRLYGAPHAGPPLTAIADASAPRAQPVMTAVVRRAAPRRAVARKPSAPHSSTSKVEIMRGTTVSTYEVGGNVH